MGNRAIIQFEGHGVEVYLHENARPEIIVALLDFTDAATRRIGVGQTFIARFVQVAANFLGGTRGIGLDGKDSRYLAQKDYDVYVAGKREHFEHGKKSPWDRVSIVALNGVVFTKEEEKRVLEHPAMFGPESIRQCIREANAPHFRGQS